MCCLVVMDSLSIIILEHTCFTATFIIYFLSIMIRVQINNYFLNSLSAPNHFNLFRQVSNFFSWNNGSVFTLLNTIRIFPFSFFGVNISFLLDTSCWKNDERFKNDCFFPVLIFLTVIQDSLFSEVGSFKAPLSLQLDWFLLSPVALFVICLEKNSSTFFCSPGTSPGSNLLPYFEPNFALNF